MTGSREFLKEWKIWIEQCFISCCSILGFLCLFFICHSCLCPFYLCNKIHENVQQLDAVKAAAKWLLILVEFASSWLYAKIIKRATQKLNVLPSLRKEEYRKSLIEVDIELIVSCLRFLIFYVWLLIESERIKTISLKNKFLLLSTFQFSFSFSISIF